MLHSSLGEPKGNILLQAVHTAQLPPHFNHDHCVTGLPKLCPQKYAFHCPRHHPQFDIHRVQPAAASSCDLSGETPEVQLFESLPQLPPDNVKEALTWLVLQLDAMCCHKVRHGSSHLKQLVYHGLQGCQNIRWWTGP